MKNHCHENIKFISIGGMSSEVVLWLAKRYAIALGSLKVQCLKTSWKTSSNAYKLLHHDWSGVLSKNANICFETQKALISEDNLRLLRYREFIWMVEQNIGFGWSSLKLRNNEHLLQKHTRLVGIHEGQMLIKHCTEKFDLNRRIMIFLYHF
jgi:hypothetical protein